MKVQKVIIQFWYITPIYTAIVSELELILKVSVFLLEHNSTMLQLER